MSHEAPIRLTCARIFLLAGVFLSSVVPLPANEPEAEYLLTSPSGNLELRIQTESELSYSLSAGKKPILKRSGLSLSLTDGRTFGLNPRLTGIGRKSVDQILRPVIKVKRAEIPDRYNELVLHFEDPFDVEFRAYDDGIAYRFVTRVEGPITVRDETVRLRFADDWPLIAAMIHCREDMDCFHSSFEEPYQAKRLGDTDPSRLAYLPVLVDIPEGPKIAFTESDLFEYPGLYLRRAQDSSTGLDGVFPSYPVREEVFGDEFKQLGVVERAGHIAVTDGQRPFPWRVVMVAERDADLILNDLVFRLARPLQIDDTSWIKPGKCTDEWIVNTNIYGVDFRSGINTQTYQYFIDVASRFGIDYVMLDAGWSNNDDMTQLNPDIDFPKLLAYARSNGIRLVLWTQALTLSRQMDRVLDQFQEWGVAGFMVDFMDRDDQKTNQFLWKVAEEAAKHQLFVLFHGAAKPTGMQRAFPNLLSSEGIMGHEFNKWSETVTPEHLVTAPFVRMLAGPLDYEGGSMQNAQKADFRAVSNNPMSQGTRAHELALYVVLESPIQYLAGNPSDYLKESETMAFFARLPTVWDETVVLGARIGDYLAVARRSGEDWHAAAITDWEPRDLDLDLSFLGPGEYVAEIYQDGINADRHAADLKRISRTVDRHTRLKVHLAPGGGWAAKISQVRP